MRRRDIICGMWLRYASGTRKNVVYTQGTPYHYLVTLLATRLDRILMGPLKLLAGEVVRSEAIHKVSNALNVPPVTKLYRKTAIFK